jgi:hypothetical protein
MQGFIALDGPLSGVERPKSQARIHTTLHKSMALFHHIIYILTVSEKALSSCRLKRQTRVVE